MTGIPAIYPAPRTVRRLEGDSVSVLTPATEVFDTTLPRQSYRLTVHDGIVLAYGDEAGLRYGRRTLDELVDKCPAGIPPLQIEDSPAFKTRAFMLDISRSRVPTRATLERIVDILAVARYNQFQLYMEHTYAYAAHEKVWGDSSPLHADDVRWLDKYCDARGIELVPNQNVFGHLEQWLAAGPEYLARAELPGGFDRGGTTHPPTTLAPCAENVAFVTGLLDELLPQFRSRSVNIGCDETFEVGLGASKPEADEKGVERVYLDYVSMVWAPLLERGYEVQFWGDIIVNAPELVDEIPTGVIPVAWWYERPYVDAARVPWSISDLTAALETDPDTAAIIRDGFAARTQGFNTAGIPYWVAPGTGAWSSLLGRITNAYANLLDAAQYSGPACDGYMVTHWGDRGSWEHPSIAFAPIMYGGAVSWNPKVDPASSISGVLSQQVFHEPEGRIARALDLMGGLWETIGVPSYNSSPIFSAFADADTGAWEQQPDLDGVSAALAVLDDCEELLREAHPGCIDGPTIVRELLSALALARFGLEGLLSPSDSSTRGEHLQTLLKEHAYCWLGRAQPGGLDRSLRNVHAMCARYGIDTDQIAREAIARVGAL
ncbi:family 20 glycosylhydrolase [Microbacterium sp. NPDC089318]